MSENPIVITGAGVTSAIGLGCEDFFNSLLRGRSGICSLIKRDDGGPKPREDESLSGHWIGAPIIGFDGKQFVSPRKALKVMSREIQLAYASSMMAIEDAGLKEAFPANEENAIPPREIGTVFGSEMLYGPPAELADAFEKCRDEDGSIDQSRFGEAAMRSVMPLWMLKYLPNMPACHVGIAINAHGPNNTLVVGDTSGTAAIAESISCLQRGIATCVISGASGTRISATRMNYRNDLPIAGTKPEQWKPHSTDAQGVVGGEAAVAFVLEKKSSAHQRNQKTLATIVAIASRFVPSDAMRQAKRSSGSESGIRGSAKAIELSINDCLKQAGITADQIGFVVSHAMADPVIDEQEYLALRETLPGKPIVVPMENVGHTGAASGSIGLITGVLSIRNNIIPPSITLSDSHRGFATSCGEKALDKDYVVCLSHTAEGSAITTLLSR